MKIKNNIAVSDSGFVFNPTTGESFSINPIGMDIFNLLKEGKNKDEIRAEILSRFQVDDATFERDFYDFVNVLNHYQLASSDEEKEN